MTSVFEADLISLAEAKEKRLKHYFTGKPCVRGHVNKRYTNTRSCVECGLEDQRSPKGLIYHQDYRSQSTRKRAQKEWHLKKNYSMTMDDFDKKMAEQSNTCEICNRPFDFDTTSVFPHVDHNHLTGKVRGIICNPCNSILGLAKEKIETLVNAASYLEKYQHNLLV